MQIFVKTGGRTISVDIEPCNSVANLKNKIYNLAGEFPVHMQPEKTMVKDLGKLFKKTKWVCACGDPKGEVKNREF